MRAIVCAPVILLLSTTVASAQIIQAVNRFANPGENEAKSTTAVASGESAAGANLLSQASAQISGSDTTQIGLEAVDLWINKFARLYTRLTLPVSSQASTATSDQTGQSSASGNSMATSAKLSQDVTKQLVDPFGGIFNVSGGFFGYLGKAGGGASEQTTARNLIQNELQRHGSRSAAADAVAAVTQIQPDHGAFVDIRGGLKFVDLPGPTDTAVAVGSAKLNVFYTGIAGLKYIAHLYDEAPTGTSADESHLAGGLTLGAYVVGNYAADPSQSSAIPTLLSRGTAALTGVIGINLPQSAAITFSMTPWASDSRLGKTFVFSFNILRPTKDTTPASTAQPAAPETPPQSPPPTPDTTSHIRGLR